MTYKLSAISFGVRVLLRRNRLKYMINLQSNYIKSMLAVCSPVSDTAYVSSLTEEARLLFYDLQYSRTYPHLRNIIILLRKRDLMLRCLHWCPFDAIFWLAPGGNCLHYLC